MQYREITGLWSARVPDGPDSDQYPDTILLEGHVTFEPEYRVPLVYPGEHIVVEPMHAVIHEGVLYGETVVGDDVVRGSLFLPVTVDENANQTWSWVAKFQGMRLGEYGEEVELPAVRFQIPPGDGPLDLSEVAPVSQSGGTITIRGPRGPGLTDITAEDGQLTFVWDGGGTRTIDVPEAVPGAAGVGVESIHESDGSVIVELSDGSTHAFPLPAGVRGAGITSITADSENLVIAWDGGPDVVIPLPQSEEGWQPPSGGSAGQVLTRAEDGGIRWGDLPEPVLDEATPSTAGLMSAADKAKLDDYPTVAALRSEPIGEDRLDQDLRDTIDRALPAPKELPVGISDRPGRFDPTTCVYVPDSRVAASVGGLFSAARGGAAHEDKIWSSGIPSVTSSRIVYMGDSGVAGKGAVPGVSDASAQAMAKLRADGVPTVDGFVAAYDHMDQNGLTNTDARISKTGTWSVGGLAGSAGAPLDYQYHIRTKQSGATITFTFQQPSTRVRIHTFGNSAAFSYTIDGGATRTYTPSGALAHESVEISGLSSTPHTLKITSTSTSTLYIFGASADDWKGTEISKIGYWGARAVAGMPRMWWSATEFLRRYEPDAIVLQYGTNEALHGGYTVDEYRGFMARTIATARRLVPGVAVYLMSSFQPNVSNATWDTWRNAQYDVADENGILLGDCVARIGHKNVADPALYSDSTHASVAGYGVQAQLLLDLLSA